MFKDDRARRSYIAVLTTFTLDLVGFSVVFPILAPLLLEPDRHFFPLEVSELYRTTMLGIAFSLFALAQFLASPLIGAAADHMGRKRLFLITIGASVIGYGILAFSLVIKSLTMLLVGRFWTGACSGNAAIAQAAVADLAYPEHRAKAFSYLHGIGGVGFVAGPWLGGLLAEPEWLGGSIPFLFVGVVSLLNLGIVYTFFSETHLTRKGGPLWQGVVESFKNIRHVFYLPKLRQILLLYFLFLMGDSMWLIFSPTYFVQRFDLSPAIIGDLYAYMSLIWMGVLLIFNKELLKHYPLKTLSIWGCGLLALSIPVVLVLPTPWLFLVVFIPLVGGAALAYSNMASLVSHAAPDELQGRALGVSGSTLSLAQIFTAAIAGPLAGLSMYLPLSVGALFSLVAGILLFRYRGHLLKSTRPRV